MTKQKVPHPLAVEDLISYELIKRRKLARLITQYRNIFSNILEGTAFLLKGVKRITLVLNVKNFKYEKYDMITSEKISNNKTLSGRAKY